MKETPSVHKKWTSVWGNCQCLRETETMFKEEVTGTNRMVKYRAGNVPVARETGNRTKEIPF